MEEANKLNYLRKVYTVNKRALHVQWQYRQIASVLMTYPNKSSCCTAIIGNLFYIYSVSFLEC